MAQCAWSIQCISSGLAMCAGRGREAGTYRSAAGQDGYKFSRALLAGKSDFLGVLDKIAGKSDWANRSGKAAASPSTNFSPALKAC